MRLAGKSAIVFGAGQTPGPRIGNGRATAQLFAREGARVLAVDRDEDSARETVETIVAAGGEARPLRADVTREDEVKAAVQRCRELWGGIDIVHNNVGVSLAGGDAEVTEITTEAFDRVMAINLRGMVLACKHALPILREQKSGAIINISSIAAHTDYALVAYKASKAGVIAFTQQLAIQNASYGIRANAIVPGLMDTPMAVDTRAKAWGLSREEVARQRDAQVPLRGKMGTAWDVAYAALFLASEEAGFITGVALNVDGGSSCRIG